MTGKLPVKWTQETVTLGGQIFPGEREFPGADLSESAASLRSMWC